MANGRDDVPFWFWLVLGLAALLAGGGVLTAGIRIALATAPTWMLWSMQLVLTALAVVGAGIFAMRSSAWALAASADQLAAVARRFPEELAAAKRRTPTFVLVALLVSEAAVIVADNSFGDNTIATLAVSFGMLLGFWAANELMIKTKVLPRILGYALWFLVLLFLPSAIMADRRWSVIQLVQAIAALPSGTKLFFGVATVLIVALPIVAAYFDDA